MSWASFISGSIGAWAVKAVTSIGVGTVTYVGFSAAKNAISSTITASLGNLGGGAYQILALAGFVDSIGIWLGAMTAAVTLLSFKKLALLNG